MDTIIFVQLPDGSWASINQSMDWGQIVIILLLVALLVLRIYALWQHR